MDLCTYILLIVTNLRLNPKLASVPLQIDSEKEIKRI